MSEQLKALGNEAFSAGEYRQALHYFDKAIEIDPTNHILYSNRSATQVALHFLLLSETVLQSKLKDYDEALKDALKVVELKPDWVKGYSRLGSAYHGLHNLEKALEAYNKGLEMDPENQLLKAGKEEVEAVMKDPKSPFANPDVFDRLLRDERTRPLLGQPEFMRMFRELQNSPESMLHYLQDPRMQLIMEVGLGLTLNKPKEDEKEEETAKSEEQGESSTKVKTEEEKLNTTREAALKEKEAGNAAYKKKQFDKAIEHYTKAIELDKEDITFLTNRAAVFLEMGNFEKCIEDCTVAMERGPELHADFKLIAKAMTRKGKALVKMDRLEEAIEIFNQSLTEHRTAETLTALRDTEKILKERQEKAYVDLDLCIKEKEAGNEAFKLQNYPEAVKHYTEALKRGPPDVYDEAYKLYSNRAACYTKLCAWHDGMRDAEKCIELKPEFGKGYSRKANIHFFMKEYEKAAEAYKKGLEVDPTSEEMKDGLRRCLEQISRIARGEASESEMQERRTRAMGDPEIQQILTDPIMAQVLKDFESDPRGAQHHLRNPDIMMKLNKLITAGIIKVQ